MSHFFENINRVKLLFIKTTLSKIHLYRSRKFSSKSTTCSTILALRPQHKTTLRENLNPKRFNNIVHKTIRNNGKQSKYSHPVTYQSNPKTTHERVNSHQ